MCQITFCHPPKEFININCRAFQQSVALHLYYQIITVVTNIKDEINIL